MSQFDTAFEALMAFEEHCEDEGIEFDIWTVAERVARKWGVSEADLVAAYDEHYDGGHDGSE